MQSISTAVLAAGSLSLHVHVTNTGIVDGDVVILVFTKLVTHTAIASLPHLRRQCPLKTLAGFARLHLSAGSSTRTTIEISPREIACVDEDGTTVLRNGTVALEAGDVADPAVASVKVTGPATVLPV